MISSLFCFAYLLSSSALAESSPSCTNFKLIDDLKAYLECQSSPKIGSCKDLNKKIASLTGNHVTAPKTLTDAQKEMLRDLAQRPGELERLLKDAVLISTVVKQVAVKSTAQLSAQKNSEVRQELVENIRDDITSSLRTKLTELGTSKSAALPQKMAAVMSKEMSDAVAKKVVERTLATGILLVDPGQGLTALAESAADTLIGKALGLLGGPVAVLVSMTKPTACDASDEVAINVQAKTSKCEPVYEVNENVARFLVDEPDKKQLALLQNPKVCAFYQKLHAKLLDQPKITSLTCHGESLVMTGKTTDGKSLEVDLAFRGSMNDSPTADGLVKQIYLRVDRAVVANPTVLADGSIRDISTLGQGALSGIMLAKLYVQNALDCCTEKNDREHSRCLASYNSSMGTSHELGSPTANPAEISH